MSSGAERVRCHDRAAIVSARCGRRVRQGSGADLGGGSLKSARFSALGNGLGTLLERQRRDRLFVATRGRFVALGTRGQMHTPSLRAKQDTVAAAGVSGPCPAWVCARHGPSVHPWRARTVPATVPATCRDRAHGASVRLRRSKAVPETSPRRSGCSNAGMGQVALREQDPETPGGDSQAAPVAVVALNASPSGVQLMSTR